MGLSSVPVAASAQPYIEYTYNDFVLYVTQGGARTDIRNVGGYTVKNMYISSGYYRSAGMELANLDLRGIERAEVIAGTSGCQSSYRDRHNNYGSFSGGNNDGRWPDYNIPIQTFTYTPTSNLHLPYDNPNSTFRIHNVTWVTNGQDTHVNSLKLYKLRLNIGYEKEDKLTA